MEKPQIKPVHSPVQLSHNRIRIGTIQYGVGSEIQDDEEGTIWQLLQLMDGSRTQAEIVQSMPHVDAESLYEAMEMLIENGFVEDASAAPPPDLTPVEVERHSRSANYFAWIDTKPRSSRYEIQHRLKQARVTILGLGGSGSAVAMSLVAAGVGAVHCVDFDVVEDSNLNRQLLYTEEDVGLPKVAQAVSRLQKLNSYVTVTGQELFVRSSQDIVPLMEDCDFFILCADTPPRKIMFWANEAALITGTPWLQSLYAGPMVVVGTFVPSQTPCYRCFDNVRVEQQRLQGQKETGQEDDVINAVIAPTASLTGHFGALEAIHFLGDLKPQTVGRIFHQNLMIFDHHYYIDAPFWAECPDCGPNAPYHHPAAPKELIGV